MFHEVHGSFDLIETPSRAPPPRPVLQLRRFCHGVYKVSRRVTYDNADEDRACLDVGENRGEKRGAFDSDVKINRFQDDFCFENLAQLIPSAHSPIRKRNFRTLSFAVKKSKNTQENDLNIESR